MEIEVNRPKQYHDKIRDYTLWADSKKIGKIKPNSLTNYTIPDDTKFIWFSIDWCSSPKLSVKDIQSNKVTVSNTMSSHLLSGLFLPIYYVTFGKNKYLTITSDA